jgi:hypothetical protein
MSYLDITLVQLVTGRKVVSNPLLLKIYYVFH